MSLFKQKRFKYNSKTEIGFIKIKKIPKEDFKDQHSIGNYQGFKYDGQTKRA